MQLSDSHGFVHCLPSSPRRSFTILLNTASGADEKSPVRHQLSDALAGHAVEFVELGGGDFRGSAEQAIKRAHAANAVVVAAGGDGTVNLVASLCAGLGTTMGIIPLGTFNYFARALGIPDDPAAAALALLDGRIATVDAGYVNQHLFLNNASFGLYTQVIRNREQDKSRLGRFRLVALLSAIHTLLRGQRPFAIKTMTASGPQVRRTTMVFVGKNALQLDNLELAAAGCVRSGELAILIVKPVSRWAMAALLLRGALRNLDEDPRLETLCADAFEVEMKRRRIAVAVDGEVRQCATPLAFRVARHCLQVIVPPGTFPR